MCIQWWMTIVAITVGVVVTGSVSASQAETLRVVGFNVESGGADPNVVDDLIARLQDIDIWGFSEVQNASWARLFEVAAEDGEGADFVQVLGTTGGGDRLLIVYDADRFELVQQFELHDINPEGRVRSPLVAHLKITATGQEFFFMVNHLFRTNDAAY